MDDTGLEKIVNKINENDILIKSLSKLIKKVDAPKDEIRIILDWLRQRQKLLKRKYSAKLLELCEVANIIAACYDGKGASTDEEF